MKSNLYTIPAHIPFADTLAEWVLEKWGHSPLVLSRALIFVPSRRAALSLREAFLRVSNGQPLLLPRIEPLGDADEDTLLLSTPQLPALFEKPSPQFALRRLFLLARLVQKQREQVLGRPERIDHALRLASSLAELLDECEREEVSLDGLQQIVPDAFAAHWQATVEFLHIISVYWPKIAEAESLISPGGHQNKVLNALALHWEQSPPATPVIAAGTTASIPSTARLLQAIATLPQGAVILPGLDCAADEAYFEHIDESHPQWGMAQLLRKLERTRADVEVIGAPQNERVRLMSEIMRPAEISDAWRHVPAFKAEATAGIQMVECGSSQEEAAVVALILRETLEHPGKTAALVTHNRNLARSVAAIMQRFGVAVDDSAGLPLAETSLATFMRLALDAARQSLAPLPLLSFLKHPLAHADMERIDCLTTARTLEILAFRGLQSGNGIEAIRERLRKNGPAPANVHALLDTLEQAFVPLLILLNRQEASLSECMDAHIVCAQALGKEGMWNGHQAEALISFVSELREACIKDMLIIEPAAYPAIFEELLSGQVVRPEYGTHPRLKILSPIEARLQSFDCIILSGLNEGSWPQIPKSDPWFSRPMRTNLGLPAPERRLGLAAHDFYNLACAPRVILTRASKESGVPGQASRWLVKLGMLTGGVNADTPWLEWGRALDRPASIAPMSPPAPKPPLAARPREISVTQVDTWMRDPYALYASKVLRLRALEPLGRAPDGSDFGNAVHKALELFTRENVGALPEDALSQLLMFGGQAFADVFAGSSMEVLWWPRFIRIAEWFIAQEEMRAPLAQTLSEAKGTLAIGELLLTGRADRIEKKADGSLAIIDYKTGGVPTAKDIESGLSNQLILLALIAREGDIGIRGEPIGLEYWQLQGAAEAGSIEPIKQAKIESYIEASKEGLGRLIARYSDPDFPYRSTPIPARAGRYSDYTHLARAKEWG